MKLSNWKILEGSPKLGIDVVKFKQNKRPYGLFIPFKVNDLISLNFANTKFYKDINDTVSLKKNILKSRNIDCCICSVNQLFEPHYTKIRYSILNNNEELIPSDQFKYWIKRFRDNYAFISINISHVLSFDEFKLISAIVSSRRTRFMLESISLSLSKLTQCISILNRLANCTELRNIWLVYEKSDFEAEYEQGAINYAVKEFKKTFGFIQNLNLSKNESKSSIWRIQSAYLAR